MNFGNIRGGAGAGKSVGNFKSIYANNSKINKDLLAISSLSSPSIKIA